MTMDAKKLDDRLLDYLYGEMEDGARAEFESALREHPSVQRELEALQRTREVVASSLGEVEPPPPVTHRLLEEATRLAPRDSERGLLHRLRGLLRLLVLHPALSAAVTFVIVVGLTIYVARRDAGPPSPLSARDFEEVAIVASRPHPSTDEAEGDEALEGLSSDPIAPKTSPEGAEVAHELHDRSPEATAQPTARSRRALDERRARRRAALKAPMRRSRGSSDDTSFDALASTKGGRAPEVGGLSAASRPPASDPRRGSKGLRARPAKLSATPVAAAPRAAKKAPAPPDEAMSEAHRDAPAPQPTERSATTDSRADEAQRWMARGRQRITSGDCDQGLESYERAITLDQRLAREIEAQLGRCSDDLARAERQFPRLAYHVRLVRRAKARQTGKGSASDNQPPARASPRESAK